MFHQEDQALLYVSNFFMSDAEINEILKDKIKYFDSMTANYTSSEQAYLRMRQNAEERYNAYPADVPDYRCFISADNMTRIVQVPGGWLTQTIAGWNEMDLEKELNNLDCRPMLKAVS